VQVQRCAATVTGESQESGNLPWFFYSSFSSKEAMQPDALLCSGTLLQLNPSGLSFSFKPPCTRNIYAWRKNYMTNPKVSTQTAQKGLTVVFTGDGKGKTSAAMGILARASGHGLSVGVIQFIKDTGRSYGEALMAHRLAIPFQSMGDGFVFKKDNQVESRQSALSAWEEAQRWMLSRKYDVLILDEITYLFLFKWLDVKETIAWIMQNKPPSMHLVLTGRYAPQELIDFADLVTEMQEIKHPFRLQGIQAQPGIDF
jgi:cob(I)alamin adenosyltransferase